MPVSVRQLPPPDPWIRFRWRGPFNPGEITAHGLHQIDAGRELVPLEHQPVRVHSGIQYAAAPAVASQLAASNAAWWDFET